VTTREGCDEARGDRHLGDVGTAEVDAAREVEQEPGGEIAVLDVLAHVGLLQPCGDVPVDVAHIVVELVFAQVGEVDAGTAEERAVVALQQPVEATDDGPLEPPQQVVRCRRRAEVAGGRPRARRARGRRPQVASKGCHFTS
jgi:hypothetical protein